MHGAASLKKKKTEFPTDMHAQCKLSGEKGKFCFLRAFSKNVLKRQIIIFHLASSNKMSKKLLRFNREGKTVVGQSSVRAKQGRSLLQGCSDEVKQARGVANQCGSRSDFLCGQRCYGPKAQKAAQQLI